MTERTKQLLDEVLKLSVSERVAFLAEVAASVDVEEGSFDPEWLAEFERRAQEARKDRSGTTLQEIEARLAERFPRR
jgi:putative addiction module component (TIGR02574 family)